MGFHEERPEEKGVGRVRCELSFNEREIELVDRVAYREVPTIKKRKSDFTKESKISVFYFRRLMIFFSLFCFLV